MSDSSLYTDEAVVDTVVRELVEDTMLDSSKIYSYNNVKYKNYTL